MDIVKTCVTLKMSFSKNCGTLKNTEIYKKFESCWLSIPAVAEFFNVLSKLLVKYIYQRHSMTHMERGQAIM